VFVVPEVVVGRRGGAAWVTTTGDADPADVLASSPATVPAGPGRLRYADGALDPASWCATVATAVQRIGAGELAKVVLARDLLVTADAPLDARSLLARLAARFPDCWTFAVDGLLGATRSCCCAGPDDGCPPACWPGPHPAGRAPTTSGWPPTCSPRPRTAPSTPSPWTPWCAPSSRTARRSPPPRSRSC
jgi:hypothetical protein